MVYIMIIQKIEKKLGSGVVSNHIEFLEAEGYKVITFRLSQMDSQDFELKIPVLNKDKSIQFTDSALISEIKKIHSSGDKLAVIFDEYENNKDRLSIIKDIIENNINTLGLTDNDIVIYTVLNDFTS